MALTQIKQDFKFVGKNIDEVQQKYDNLIQDSSYTFLKYEHYLSGLQNNFLATDNRTQQLNEHQHEVIKATGEPTHLQEEHNRFYGIHMPLTKQAPHKTTSSKSR